MFQLMLAALSMKHMSIDHYELTYNVLLGTYSTVLS